MRGRYLFQTRSTAHDPSRQSVIAEFFAQGGAVDTEEVGCTALVAFAMLQHLREQRDFHLAQNHLIDIITLRTVQIVQIALDRLGDMFTQRYAPGAGGK